MVASGGGVKNSIQDLAEWTAQTKTVLLGILTTSSRAELGQGVAEAAALAAKMLNGIDSDENGVIDAIVGEGGAQAAYEQAYQMADMPLQAVGIMNLGTGTPTFILVAPSKTPGGGGGSGGSTTGSTPQAPGQQRTPRPQNTKNSPPKTKKPTGNNTGSTSNTTTNNNGNGNGNGN
jgi:hypothetical protein